MTRYLNSLCEIPLKKHAFFKGNAWYDSQAKTSNYEI